MIQHCVVYRGNVPHDLRVLRVYPEPPVNRVLEPFLNNEVLREVMFHRAGDVRNERLASVVEQAGEPDLPGKPPGACLVAARKAVLTHGIEASEMSVGAAQQRQRMSDVLREDILGSGVEGREKNAAPGAYVVPVSHEQFSVKTFTHSVGKNRSALLQSGLELHRDYLYRVVDNAHL